MRLAGVFIALAAIRYIAFIQLLEFNYEVRESVD